MPYVRANETDTLTLPSNSAYHVVMKKRASYGDRLAMQKAMLQISQVDLASVEPSKVHLVEADVETGKGVMTEIEIDGYMRSLLVRLIVSWNLDGEDGEIMPITQETIELLEPEDGDFLNKEAQRRLMPRAVVIERPFDGRSPQQSKVTVLNSGKRSRH